MKVLVACEFSGVVRDAFRARGHDAISCDLLPSERPGPHVQGDIMATGLLEQRFDLVIAHPPCTYLAHSGIRWLFDARFSVDRFDLMEEAVRFFKACLAANAPRVAVENPVVHRWARAEIGSPTFSTQPWQHGHGVTKRTQFWLRGLDPLRPTLVVSGRQLHHDAHFGLGKMKYRERAAERSRTFPGIAAAMAEQWGTPHETLFSAAGINGADRLQLPKATVVPRPALDRRALGPGQRRADAGDVVESGPLPLFAGMA